MYIEVHLTLLKLAYCYVMVTDNLEPLESYDSILDDQKLHIIGPHIKCKTT